MKKIKSLWIYVLVNIKNIVMTLRYKKVMRTIDDISNSIMNCKTEISLDEFLRETEETK